jgi:hypothetical protein
MSTRWICEGSVCGSCEVRHRSALAAVRCCNAHDARIKAYNGPRAFSDREPMPEGKWDWHTRTELWDAQEQIQNERWEG